MELFKLHCLFPYTFLTSLLHGYCASDSADSVLWRLLFLTFEIHWPNAGGQTSGNVSGVRVTL